MFKEGRTAKIAAVTAVAIAAAVLCGGVAAASTWRVSAPRAAAGRHHPRGHHAVSTGAQPGVFGTVASVNGTSTTGTCGTADAAGDFTLTAWKNTTYTVNVSAPPTTTFVDSSATTPSFADVCVGDLVGAQGAVSDDTVTATTVYVAPAKTTPPHQPGVFGPVASVNGTSTYGHNPSGDPEQGGHFATTSPPKAPAGPVDPASAKSWSPNGQGAGSAPATSPTSNSAPNAKNGPNGFPNGSPNGSQPWPSASQTVQDGPGGGHGGGTGTAGGTDTPGGTGTPGGRGPGALKP